MTSSKRYFEKVAADWDSLRKGLFSERVRDKAIALASPRGGAMALDLGAGTGFMSEGLLSQGLRVVAVDESPEMLSKARGKLAGQGAIEFRVGDAQMIPADDESFDYLFANMLLHHVEKPEAAVREMARVLKPGGVLVVTDLDEHDFVFLRSEQHDRWMGFDRRVVQAWLRGAGLMETRVVGLDEDCCSTSATGVEAKVGIFAAVGAKPIHNAN